METTIISESNSELSFPIIARSIDDDAIVLFQDKNIGTVLHSGDSDYELGFYYNDWISVFTVNVWEIIPEITINFKS